MNWHKKLQGVLENDINSRPKELDELEKELKDNIHGNTNVKTEDTTGLLYNICNKYLSNLGKFNIEIKESSYNCNEDKGLDTPFLNIIINIQGKWNGEICIKTIAGTKSDTGKSIYYIMDSDFNMISNLENKIKSYYIDTYERLLEEEFLNLSIDKNLYLELDTKFKKYTLWDREPLEYSDIMSGEYDYNTNCDDYYLKTYDMYKTLKKIRSYDNFTDFIEKKAGDGVGYTTETTEWRNYYI